MPREESTATSEVRSPPDLPPPPLPHFTAKLALFTPRCAVAKPGRRGGGRFRLDGVEFAPPAKSERHLGPLPIPVRFVFDGLLIEQGSTDMVAALW